MKRDLPIVQKTYDLVKWYVPILNRLPRDHKFLLGAGFDSAQPAVNYAHELTLLNLQPATDRGLSVAETRILTRYC